MAFHDYVLPVPQRGYDPFVEWYKQNIPAADTCRIYAAGYEQGKPHIFELWFLHTALTTDANPANRYIRHKWRGEVWTRDSVKSGACAASMTLKYKWGHINDYTANPSDDSDAVSFLMGYLLFKGNEYLEIFIDNEQAGDTFDVTILARYRSYDMGIFPDPRELSLREIEQVRHSPGYWSRDLSMDPRYR